MKKTNILLTICCVLSVLSLLLSLATFINVNGRLNNNEKFWGISSASKEKDEDTKLKEPEKNIEYDTITLGNALVSYPKKGTYGTEGDSKYMIIEDISITPSFGTSLGSETEYDFNFLGKYDGYFTFYVKQYDAEDFCIDEAGIHLIGGIKNEHIKDKGFFSIDDTATRVVIDIADY